jgi:tRNA pseudouridine55 synthase
MARRRKGRAVHGWIALDKPLGMTSTHAVAMIKRLFDAQKVGHAGTLDPLASGCLPIALGDATKTVPYVMDARKVYCFAVQWGEERNTDDREGVATHLSDKTPDDAAITALLPHYTGLIRQTPPLFSAVKIQGERAYDLARDGEIPDVQPRDVMIHRLQKIADDPVLRQSFFEVECGRGTYVRALARDMGQELGCFGHIAELRRSRVGAFTAATLITPDKLAALAELGEENMYGALLPVQHALDSLHQLHLPAGDMAPIRHGHAVLLRGRDMPVDGPAYVLDKKSLLAIGEVESGYFNPSRVFGG